MNGAVEIVLILAAIGYVLVRRWIGEPARGRRMLALPAVLSLVGFADLFGHARSPLSMLFLTGTTAISVVLGALRGASVRITERDGLPFVRYSAVTVALWVANLAVKFGADAVLGAMDPNGAGGNNLLFTLGLGILAEGAVVLYRAPGGSHRAMSGSDRGGPARPIPALPQHRRRSLAP